MRAEREIEEADSMFIYKINADYRCVLCFHAAILHGSLETLMAYFLLRGRMA